ncbi:Uncharacterised protein g7511 [Pycnogonum litorale]
MMKIPSSVLMKHLMIACAVIVMMSPVIESGVQVNTSCRLVVDRDDVTMPINHLPKIRSLNGCEGKCENKCEGKVADSSLYTNLTASIRRQSCCVPTKFDGVLLFLQLHKNNEAGENLAGVRSYDLNPIECGCL